MTVKISSLTSSFKATLQWQAQNSPLGSDYQPLTNSNTITKKVSLGTALANNTSGGADELYSAVTLIGGGNTAQINLQNFTDALGQSAASIVRLKSFCCRLLSLADDGVVGTNCTGITLGNSLPSPNKLFFGGNTNTAIIGNGEFLQWATPNGPGLTVTAGTSQVNVANNDGTNTAAVEITFSGGSA